MLRRQRTRNKRNQRFRKRDSDRSGFTFRERQLVRDKGSLVGPGEFDTPPPSEESLGGEGDVSQGDIRPDSTSFATPSGFGITLKFITAGGGISFENRIYPRSQEVLNNSFFQIVGSNAAIDISKDPQISAGQQNQQLTLECVGSSVTLQDGNGLSLYNQYVMDSGSLISFIYNSGNSVWQETSRSSKTEQLGVF